MTGLRWLVRSSRKYHVRRHRHTYWEIVYYTEGSGTLLIGDEPIEIRPGLIVCQPPVLPHDERSTVGFANYCFGVERFHLTSVKKPLVYEDTTTKDFLSLLENLYRYAAGPSSDYRPLTTALLFAMEQMLRTWADVANRDAYVDWVQRQMAANLNNTSFDLGTAIREAGVSTSYFRRKFQKAYGLSPTQWLQRERIDYAMNVAKLAGPGRRSVKELAYLSGFEDPYYFSRVFKKWAGVSPREWMENGGEINN